LEVRSRPPCDRARADAPTQNEDDREDRGNRDGSRVGVGGVTEPKALRYLLDQGTKHIRDQEEGDRPDQEHARDVIGCRIRHALLVAIVKPRELGSQKPRGQHQDEECELRAQRGRVC
jgi:hypothetical protein